MPRDDREQNFDKALAHNLRSNVPSNSGELKSLCPDAQILAAYHERLLEPEEIDFWKEHISGCLNCQGVLATLEASDDLLVETYSNNVSRDVAQDAKENASGDEGRAASMPVYTAQAAQRAGLRRTVGENKTVDRMSGARRPSKWRLLVPVGAVAAGLLLWVAGHETHSNRVEVADNVQKKEVRPPQLSEQNNPAVPNATATERRIEPTVPPPYSGDTFDNVVRGQSTKAEADRDTAAKVGNKSSRSQTQTRDLPLNGRADLRGAMGLRSGAAQAGPATANLEKQTAASPAPPPAATPALTTDSVSNSVEVSAPPPEAKPGQPNQGAAGAVSAAQQQTVEQQAMQGRSEFKQAIPMLAAKKKSSGTIAAPDGMVLWRLASAGIIERSTDGGATWTVQKSGVIADLVAGSATSDKVCWVVGRGGIILRTTDGGAQWQKLRPPTARDFTAVFAVDARQATVSDAASRKSYRTVDGGDTWTELLQP